LKYAILDIESTGGQRIDESIIEIAVFLFDGQNQIKEFSSLVNPKKAILPYVEKLTGINQKTLENAPEFCQIAPFILEITKEAILVGHGVDFDYYVLKLEYSRLGIKFERQILDTLILSKKYFPNQKNYSLKKLCAFFEIPLDGNNHRAQVDAKATLELFKYLLKKV
jgi:DNA polymerase III subunit epsilon